MLTQQKHPRKAVSLGWIQLAQLGQEGIVTGEPAAADEAVVISVISQGQKWRIRFYATDWYARPLQPNVQLQPDEKVQVVGRQGLVLLIQQVPA